MGPIDFGDAAVQGRASDTEELRRSSHAAARHAESLLDGAFLELAQRDDAVVVVVVVRGARRDGSGYGIARRSEIGRQVAELDDVAAGREHTAMHHVLELAHVAGPGVTRQRFERVGSDVADAVLPSSAGASRESAR